MKRRCSRKCSMKEIRALCIVLAPIGLKFASIFTNLTTNALKKPLITFKYYKS